jgi:hypothetical protein
MGRRKKGVQARLNNLGHHAQKVCALLLPLGNLYDNIQDSSHQDSELEEDTLRADLETIHTLDEVESSIPAGSLGFSPSPPHNSSQHTLSSLGSDSELSDVEIMDEEHCKSFATTMQQNLSKFLESLKGKARPARYNPANPAPRTKRGRAQKIREDTKALCQAGYPDIRTFLRQG